MNIFSSILVIACCFRLDEARGRLVSLLASSIVDGESNSLLVIGPRGSGKTRLLKSKYLPSTCLD